MIALNKHGNARKGARVSRGCRLAAANISRWRLQSLTDSVMARERPSASHVCINFSVATEFVAHSDESALSGSKTRKNAATSKNSANSSPSRSRHVISIARSEPCGNRASNAYPASCPRSVGTASSSRSEAFPASGGKDDSSIFSPAEAAKLIGIHEGYLRQLVAEGRGASASVNERSSDLLSRAISIAFASFSISSGKGRSPRICRIGLQARHLQIISVMNFKGGSGKTTTAAHLAQYLGVSRISRSGDRPRSSSQSFDAFRSSAGVRCRTRTRRFTEQFATTLNGGRSVEIVRGDIFPTLASRSRQS